jgi:hypothetical protein
LNFDHVMILELRLSIHLHIQQVYFRTGLIILKLKAVVKIELELLVRNNTNPLDEMHIDCILGDAL